MYCRHSDTCGYLEVTVTYVTAFVPAKLIILALAKHITIILHTLCYNLIFYSSSNKTVRHISSSHCDSQTQPSLRQITQTHLATDYYPVKTEYIRFRSLSEVTSHALSRLSVASGNNYTNHRYIGRHLYTIHVPIRNDFNNKVVNHILRPHSMLTIENLGTAHQ